MCLCVCVRSDMTGKRKIKSHPSPSVLSSQSVGEKKGKEGKKNPIKLRRHRSKHNIQRSEVKAIENSTRQTFSWGTTCDLHTQRRLPPV